MFIKNILIKQKSMCQSKSAHTLHIFTATQPQTLVICYCSCCGGSGGGMRVSLAICSSCSGSCRCSRHLATANCHKFTLGQLVKICKCFHFQFLSYLN